ncbi:hypothetical protein [Mycolicibacterium gilvum]|uniref:hypothetical protein n=1 Tax=Mycolicibacterium gilvum TaxID=1804 RepID=UPI004045DEA9
MPMFRRTRQNELTTLRDLTEGTDILKDAVESAIDDDLPTRGITVADLGDNTFQWMLSGAPIGGPFTPGAAYPLSAVEQEAGLEASDIANAIYLPGHVYRYVNNADPGTTDATAGWQTFLSLGGFIELDARVNDIFRITAQLLIKGGTTLRMGSDCVMLRDWSASSGNKPGNAFFKNEHAPAIADLAVNPGPWVPTTTDDDIYIEGGRIRPVNSTKIGCGYYLMGTKNLTLRDTVVERTHQDWAFIIGGDNFSARGVRVENNSELFEDGFHILYGSGVVDADYIHSGDDSFAIGSNWNLPVNGVDIRMGRFHSEKAFGIKVVQNREGSTAEFPAPTSKIQNVRFHSGTGTAGWVRNGLIRMEATGPGLLSDITVDGVLLDAGTETHDGVNPHGVHCRYVTRLKLRDVVSKNARAHAFWIQDCPDAELSGLMAHDSQGTTTWFALELQDCLNAKVTGGEFVRTTTTVARAIGTTTASFHGPLFREIGNGASGINVRDNAVVRVNGATFRKASGATSAIGILSGHSTVSIAADGCTFDVDRPYAMTAAAAYARLSRIARTVTVSSGAITTYGDDSLRVLCEGGVTDTLGAISGGYRGQTLTIVNGEADPTTAVLTLTAGTGANQINIGANYVLNTAASAITLYFNGTNWVPISVDLNNVTLTGAQTVSQKRIQPRVSTNTTISSTTPNVANVDIYVFSALGSAITINAPTGTPAHGERLEWRFKDNGTSRAFTWNSIFRAMGTTLPTATVVGKWTHVVAVYDSIDSKWDVIDVKQEA